MPDTSLDFCGLAPNQPNQSSAIVLAGNTTRDMVLGAVGLIPAIDEVPVGSIAKGFIGYFWDDKADLWAALAARITALIHKLIDEQELKTLTSDLAGMRDAWKLYAAETYDNPEKKTLHGAALLAFTTNRHRFFDANRPERTLPHLVALGTMHLLLLYDQAVHFREIYGADDPQADTHRDDLRNAIDEYSNAVKKARTAALDLRRSLITVGSTTAESSDYLDGWTRTTYTVRDEQEGDSTDFVMFVGSYQNYGDNAEQDARNHQAALQADRVPKLASALDDFLAPTRAWSFFDPDVAQVPSPAPAQTSDVLGSSSGTAVSASVPAGATLTKIGGAFTGNRLARLTLTYRDAAGHESSAAIGSGGSTPFELAFLSRETAVAACVGVGAGIEGFRVITNMGNVTGGGRSDGTRTLVVASGSDPTVLSGVKGWTDASGTIVGLQLEWRVIAHLPTRAQALRTFWNDRLGGIPAMLSGVSNDVWNSFFVQFRNHSNVNEAAMTTAYVLQNAVAPKLPGGSVDYQSAIGSDVYGWTTSNAATIYLAAVDTEHWNAFMSAFQGQADADSAAATTSYLLQSASATDTNGTLDYASPEAAWVWGWVNGHRRMLYRLTT